MFRTLHQQKQTTMKNFRHSLLLPLAFIAAACNNGTLVPETPEPVQPVFTMQNIAQMFSSLPLGAQQLDEVYQAACSSSGNGYDEEYTLRSLFQAPGSGVGSTKASVNLQGVPLKDMITDYLQDKYSTKAGVSDVEKYIDELIESDYQIYWPYSEDWDGETFPIITFDPGYGAESNYGYRISFTPYGAKVVDSVYVDENVALQQPVWVINKNTDQGFTTMEMLTKQTSYIRGESGSKALKIKTFNALRNYDSWFGGASEFVIRAGSMDGCKAYSEDDLKKFYPTLTEMAIVVKRKDVGKDISFDSILVGDFTDQLDKIALLLTEDDGGTRTIWKCSTTVKYNSKAYGFDIELPYNDKDDIVWRGTLSADYFKKTKVTKGRFGDVKINFELE